MPRRWLYSGLVLLACVGIAFCLCEPGCCQSPPFSANPSSPVAGPNCPCGPAVDADQRFSFTVDSEILILDATFLAVLPVMVDRPVLHEGQIASVDLTQQLFVVHHQLVI